MLTMSHLISCQSPQGNILGPLILFVLFIDNLSNNLKSAIPFLFADDTKCLQLIRCPEDAFLLLARNQLKTNHKYIA